eukprot:1686970-Prymnesium_polylepis.1
MGRARSRGLKQEAAARALAGLRRRGPALGMWRSENTSQFLSDHKSVACLKPSDEPPVRIRLRSALRRGRCEKLRAVERRYEARFRNAVRARAAVQTD